MKQKVFWREILPFSRITVKLKMFAKNSKNFSRITVKLKMFAKNSKSFGGKIVHGKKKSVPLNCV